ncbi:MAG TPA: hypothetical protein VFN21_05470 [Acidimicrobiales bacterium]|nr:hypothetical protein [Acidimicrobiales bacterium]
MRNMWKGFVIGSVMGAAIGIALDKANPESDDLIRNVWKGLLIGSVAGSTVGVVVDGGSKAGRRLVEVGTEVDFGAKADELRAQAERVAQSDVVQTAADRARDAARSGADVLHQANDAVGDLAASLDIRS